MEFLQTNTNRRSGRDIIRRAKYMSDRPILQAGEAEELSKAYPDILNFYNEPPSYSISLEEFEKYAVERLKMLRLIEKINQQHESRYSNLYYNDILKNVKPNELPNYDVLLGTKNYDDSAKLMARKVDHIAHFLLRLAFARTDEQRKWFMSMEVDYLRLRLYVCASYDTMLKKNEIPIVDATEETKNFIQDIRNATFTFDGAIKIYKVHFTQALDLVRHRTVLLRDGYAYVPMNELPTVICLKFRSYLSESLSVLKKNIHLVDDDDRLRPLVSGFEKRHLGCTSDSTSNKGDVTVAQLADFSIKSFPLCMKQLYDVVEKEHHLKHWGRLQLGLFFKGLGLPIEEAIKFWRNNFTKKPEIDSSRFDKQYLYNIRHMYGKEGKRADYTPYSCMKVITSNVGPGDHHGCPFRHSDATPLRVKFVEAGIPQEGVKEIMTLVEQKHYQFACQKYFEWTHDKHTVDGGVNHPNQYFLESRNVLTGKKTIKSENKTEAPRTLIYKNGSSQVIKAEDIESMEIENDESSSVQKDPVDLNEDDGNDEIFGSMEY